MHVRIKDHQNPGLEFSLDISEASSVRDLKGLLSSEYPSQPSSACQKLIFSGKLLSDEEILGDITRRYETDTHTFHLLITAPLSEGHASTEEQTSGLRRRGEGPGNAPPNVVVDEANPGIAGAAGAAGAAIGPPAERRGFLETQNFQLFLKLALVLYIFGRGAGSLRLGIMIVAAFMVYMCQIGLLGSPSRPARVRAQVQRPPPMMRLAVPVPHAPLPADAAAAPAGAEDAPPELEPVAVVPDESTTSSHPDVDIPMQGVAQGGVLENVVGPFFYSLMPSWTPEAGFM